MPSPDLTDLSKLDAQPIDMTGKHIVVLDITQDFSLLAKKSIVDGANTILITEGMFS